MKKVNYTKSFLLIWHILFALALIWFSSIIISEYIRTDKLFGIAITLFMAALYFWLIFYSSRLFEEERYGFAYFLSITGFLGTIFLQFISCVNIVPFQMH